MTKKEKYRWEEHCLALRRNGINPFTPGLYINITNSKDNKPSKIPEDSNNKIGENE